MKRNLLLALPWFAAYSDPPAGDPPPPAGDPPPPAKDPPKTYTQEHVNKLLADDRRKHKEQVQQAVAQLEDMKKTVQMSDQQRAELEGRIENLNTSLMTAEEKTKAELGKKDKELKTLAEGLTSERDRWRSSYSQEVITNQILKSSAIHDAVSADQMLDFLAPKTRLVEVLDADGKTVKGYIPKAKIRTVNEKGEEIELDLTVEETMKRLKEDTSRYGNLFKGGVNSGIGGKGSTGGSGSASLEDLAKGPAETYRANRAKFGLGKGIKK